jgi:hypothetical protein
VDDVRTDIHFIAARRMFPAAGAPAERRGRFEHGYAHAGIGKRHRAAQACEPPADDRDIVRRSSLHPVETYSAVARAQLPCQKTERRGRGIRDVRCRTQVAFEVERFA